MSPKPVVAFQMLRCRYARRDPRSAQRHEVGDRCRRTRRRGGVTRRGHPIARILRSSPRSTISIVGSTRSPQIHTTVDCSPRSSVSDAMRTTPTIVVSVERDSAVARRPWCRSPSGRASPLRTRSRSRRPAVCFVRHDCGTARRNRSLAQRFDSCSPGADAAPSANVPSVAVDEAILDHYADARQARLRGNDAWITAATRRIGATLVTADEVLAQRADELVEVNSSQPERRHALRGAGATLPAGACARDQARSHCWCW